MTSPSKKMLRISEVTEWLNVSKSTIYSWVREGDFPKPIILGNGDRSAASRWLKEEIDLWLESRPRGVQGD